MSASAIIRPRSLIDNVRGVVLLLFACVMLLPWGRALGGCNNITNAPDVSFSPPTSITVPFNAPVGTVIYSGPQVAPSPTISITCTGGSSTYGIINSVGAQPGAGATIYPSGVSGVGYRLAHGTSTSYMLPWGCCELDRGTYSLSVTTALQLVKTGTIISGTQLPSGTLARWQYDRNPNGVMSAQDYVLASAVTFVSPACQANASTLAVALPRISTTALPTPDSTAGNTPFRISLTCSSGVTVKIMFSTTTPAVPAKTGVIASSGGTSAGVGVQITNSTDFTPIAFGAVNTVGATPNGALDLSYNARYYRTGAVTPGTVNATATFTLSYE